MGRKLLSFCLVLFLTGLLTHAGRPIDLEDHADPRELFWTDIASGIDELKAFIGDHARVEANSICRERSTVDESRSRLKINVFAYETWGVRRRLAIEKVLPDWGSWQMPNDSANTPVELAELAPYQSSKLQWDQLAKYKPMFDDALRSLNSNPRYRVRMNWKTMCFRTPPPEHVPWRWQHQTMLEIVMRTGEELYLSLDGHNAGFAVPHS